MAYNKYISIKTVKGLDIIPGEVFARKVEPDKYILFRLTYQNKPQVIGLTVPQTKQDMIKYYFLTKEEARKLK